MPFYVTFVLIITFCVIYPHGRRCLPGRLAGFLPRCFGLPPTRRLLGGRPRYVSSISENQQVNQNM